MTMATSHVIECDLCGTQEPYVEAPPPSHPLLLWVRFGAVCTAPDSPRDYCPACWERIIRSGR